MCPGEEHNMNPAAILAIHTGFGAKTVDTEVSCFWAVARAYRIVVSTIEFFLIATGAEPM
jgi:hypothetical protein